MSDSPDDKLDERKDLAAAEQLISRARDTVSGATKVITAWGITLITIWFLTLEPLASNAAREKRARDLAQWDSVEKVRAQQRHLHLRARLLRPVSGNDTLPLAAGTPPRRIISPNDTVKSARSLQAHRAQRRAVPTVPIRLVGIQVDVPETLAALLWLATSLGLLWYLSSKRAEVLNLFSQAVAACRGCPAALQTRMSLWFSGAPSWLAPFPRSNPDAGIRVDGATGLRLDRGRSLLVPVLIFASLVLLQLRVLWIGILASIGEDRAFPDGALATLSGLAISGATLVLILNWWRPWKPSVEGERPVDVSKRDFLLLLPWAAVAYVFAVTGLSALQRQHWPRWVRRDRGTRPAGTLAAGFYVNPKSGIVHHIGGDGRIRRVGKDARLERFRPVTDRQVASLGATPSAVAVPATLAGNMVARPVPPHAQDTPTSASPPPVASTESQSGNSGRRDHPPKRVSSATYSLAYETAAIEHLRRADWPGAAELLLAAIRQNVPQVLPGNPHINWRLYHLLGGICIRFDLRKQYDELVGILNSLPVDEAKDLITKWNDPAIPWTKRWRDRTRPITFAFSAPPHRLRF